jgi:hypothetical protein
LVQLAVLAVVDNAVFDPVLDICLVVSVSGSVLSS